MTTVFMELALSACATTFTPGPNNILLLSSTSTFGFKKCRPLIFGIWTGLVTVMLICGFGCAVLGELVPQIVPYAKYIGAAYMLYLAYKTFTRKTGSGTTEVDAQPLKYVNGFLLQFLNVKIMMLGVTFYSGFIMPHGFHVPYILAFAVIMAACAGTGNLIWATLGTLIFPFYKKYAKIINTVMALLLVWCAWKIAFT